MDWAFVHRIWEKWASNSVGSPGLPLKAALLINYDPTGPSRLLSTIVEQEAVKADPMELSQFVSFVKRNKLQAESFFIGQNQYLVTSIHESWFSARCMNTSKAAGEGAIVMQTAAFLLVGLYDGSIGSASRAMVAVDQFALHWNLSGFIYWCSALKVLILSKQVLEMLGYWQVLWMLGISWYWKVSHEVVPTVLIQICQESSFT
ncbi:uncharacterized protein [Coffea arabica]|uniref:Uncharacterized protein LOC113699001 isoform X1 n=1 Tax=Coffea arabica TaxID=13443 RepID=A0A6P6T9H9_COFAR|nr:uncharacterized protein LOC113699001 isoform X1 [Coffea arabica]XP_027074830.1 uncharacterized protein LOC113699001 isoform X1 [Coffea arabica]